MAAGVPKRIAKNIKRFRQAAGLTQKALAEKMGVSLRYVSTLEQSPGNLNLRTLERIARTLKVDVADLVVDPAGTPDDRVQRIAAAEELVGVLHEYVRSKR